MEDHVLTALLQIRGDIGDIKGDLGKVRGECEFFPQMRTDLNTLIENQAKSGEAVSWLKKFFWIVVGSSVASFLAALGAFVIRRA